MEKFKRQNRSALSFAQEEEDSSDDDFGPAIPKDLGPKPTEETKGDLEIIPEENNNEDEDIDKLVEEYMLPVSHEAVLKFHTHSVTTIEIDNRANRMITGGLDQQIAFWDFSGMDASLRNFRSCIPHAGYPVKKLSFSPTSSHFIAITGN